MGRRGRSLATAVAVVLAEAAAALVSGCVDGVTPDCSDAAARCAPNLDGAPQDTAARDVTGDVDISDAGGE